MTSPQNGFPRLQLGVSQYDLDGCRVLALVGECDLATRDLLRAGLEVALAQARTALIVDMLHLRFCDGAGAALILIAAQTHPVALAGLSGPARHVFDVLDPANEVPRYPSVEHAVDDLSERA